MLLLLSAYANHSPLMDTVKSLTEPVIVEGNVLSDFVELLCVMNTQILLFVSATSRKGLELEAATYPMPYPISEGVRALKVFTTFGSLWTFPVRLVWT